MFKVFKRGGGRVGESLIWLMGASFSLSTLVADECSTCWPITGVAETENFLSSTERSMVHGPSRLVYFGVWTVAEMSSESA